VLGQSCARASTHCQRDRGQGPGAGPVFVARSVLSARVSARRRSSWRSRCCRRTTVAPISGSALPGLRWRCRTQVAVVAAVHSARRCSAARAGYGRVRGMRLEPHRTSHRAHRVDPHAGQMRPENRTRSRSTHSDHDQLRRRRPVTGAHHTKRARTIFQPSLTRGDVAGLVAWHASRRTGLRH
jgi:hypothetical protein